MRLQFIGDAWDKPGVYEIDVGEKKFYIGSSKRAIKKRISEHNTALSHNKHYNKKLQNAYNNSTTVKYRVLENCSIEKVCSKEQEYIDRLHPELNIIQNVAWYSCK